MVLKMGFGSFHLIQWSHMPSHTTISLLCGLIEGQLVKGLREDHSVIEGKAQHAHYHKRP